MRLRIRFVSVMKKTRRQENKTKDMMKTKTIKTPLMMTPVFDLTCCPSPFVPESELSHNVEAHHGLVPKPSHHGGKNIASLKNHSPRCKTEVCNAQLFLWSVAERCFCFFLVVNHAVMDGGARVFYLGACTQGKVYCRNIRDAVSTRKKSFFGFC